jgi:probable HAF family extracellular repeat protein
VFHAFSWQNGTVTDLGSLGGADYCISGGINARGEVVGGSENGEIDPLTGINESRAFRFKNGAMEDLGTLGGYEASMTAAKAWELLRMRSLLVPCDENHQDIEDCDYGMVEGSAAVTGENARPAPAMQLHPETKFPFIRQMLRRLMRRALTSSSGMAPSSWPMFRIQSRR